MSVANNTPALALFDSLSQNWSYTTTRFCCDILPCRHRSGVPGRSLRNASYTNFTWLQVEKNTMILDDRCVLMNDQTTSILSCRLQIIYACSSLTGVGLEASACADTYSVLDASRLRRARLFTDFVCVAENSSVCRSRFELGRFCRIALTVALNPMSRIRSASSNTSTFTLLALKSGDSSICCSSRPGVHTRIFITPTLLASCCTSLPPMRRPADRSCCSPTTRSSSNICMANSRVGEMMMAPNPSSGLQRSRYSRSKTGIRNASVLPEPVLAAPRTSRPHSACGMAARWIAVRLTYLAFLRAALVFFESGPKRSYLRSLHHALASFAAVADVSWAVSVPRGGVDSANTASINAISSPSASVFFFFLLLLGGFTMVCSMHERPGCERRMIARSFVPGAVYSRAWWCSLFCIR